jgi:hypothetical protein
MIKRSTRCALAVGRAACLACGLNGWWLQVVVQGQEVKTHNK